MYRYLLLFVLLVLMVKISLQFQHDTVLIIRRFTIILLLFSLAYIIYIYMRVPIGCNSTVYEQLLHYYITMGGNDYNIIILQSHAYIYCRRIAAGNYIHMYNKY